MKKLLALVTSYLIAFSPVMARDIVAPRADESIRFITKPGGTPTTAMEVSAGNGVSIDGVTLKDGEVISKSNFSVGSIQQSILTEAQFQALNGTNWVKIKGQSIAGSKLCTQYSICTLPNAEGRYLRDSVADASLGTTLDQDTKLNGITAHVTAADFEHDHTLNGSVIDHDYGTGSFSMTVSSYEHIHKLTIGYSATDDPVGTSQRIAYRSTLTSPYEYRLGGTDSGTDSQMAGNSSSDSHSHTATILKSNFDHSHGNTFSVGADSKSTNTAVTFANDGTETRPDSLIINTFIKIN